MDWGNAYYGSNVPCDVPPPRDVETKHLCPNCKTKWTAIMNYELGGCFYYNDDEAYCPECDTEGEII